MLIILFFMAFVGYVTYIYDVNVRTLWSGGNSGKALLFVFTLVLLILYFIFLTEVPIKHEVRQVKINSIVKIYDGVDTCMLVASDIGYGNEYFKLPYYDKLVPDLAKIDQIRIKQDVNIFGKYSPEGKIDSLYIRWRFTAKDTALRGFNYFKYFDEIK